MDPQRIDWLIGRLREVHLEAGTQYGETRLGGRTSASDDLPLRIGRYEIHGELGRGGMGRVFRAYDPEMKRFVALKVLNMGVETDRLWREAQAAARVSHPNIVTVFDVSVDPNGAYLAMELIEGATLAKAWAEWPWRKVTQSIEIVARAVAHAHLQGVIHRDLKPANVMIAANGEVKVLDLGLARVEGGQTLTGSGDSLGTPAYMAPEQVQGKRATASADIWALGVMLYEGLTGELPFGSEAVGEVFTKILNDDPVPPRALNPRVPWELEVLCLKALEKRPEARFASAADLADELKRWLDGESIRARPASWASLVARRIRRHKAVSILTAILVLGLAEWGAEVAWREIRFRRALAEGTEASLKEAVRLDPDSAEAERGLRRLEAEGLVAFADGRAAELDEVHARLVERKSAETELEGTAARLDAESEVARERLRLEDLFFRAESSYAEALATDPGNLRARQSLARLYSLRYLDAEDAGDVVGQAAFADKVRLYDSLQRYVPLLSGRGRVSIRTTPPGAQVTISRYVPIAGEGRVEVREEMPLGVSPIVDVPVDRGSFLLRIVSPGKRETRVPVLVERDKALTLVVPLYSEEEIGAGFVYVPPGPFVLGGDPRAYGSYPRRTAVLEGFFVSRCEVTTSEYAAYLEELWTRDPKEAAARVPRRKDETLWTIHAGEVGLGVTQPDWPVACVTWHDAKAYCAWRTSRETGWEVRLPTELEWEKAARGADGRAFPWGDGFEWSYCRGAAPGAGPGLPFAAGTCARDESPYGAMDMAGSVFEWCGDLFDAVRGYPNLRGGSWVQSNPQDFRAASHGGMEPELRFEGCGFRVVKVPKAAR